MPGQIHRQEGDVCAQVGVAEALVELDAIEDRYLASFIEVDVLQPKVSVPVADPLRRDPVLEEGRVLGQETLSCHVSISSASSSWRGSGAHDLACLREILGDVALDGGIVAPCAEVSSSHRTMR